MRDLGWTTTHTLHEMRAYFGRRMEAQYGLEATREVMRHSSAATTKKHYSGSKSLRGVIVQMPTMGREERKTG